MLMAVELGVEGREGNSEKAQVAGSQWQLLL